MDVFGAFSIRFAQISNIYFVQYDEIFLSSIYTYINAKTQAVFCDIALHTNNESKINYLLTTEKGGTRHGIQHLEGGGQHL